jgi:ribosomal protein S18 acetylase RimI-like enzyme
MKSVSFRPAVEADIPFLVELRKKTMTAHEVASGLHRSAEHGITRVRASFQCAQVILQAGEAVGLLKVVRHSSHWELLQIQLTPQFQGKGIGTTIIRSVLAEARTIGVGVRLGVLKANPARKLYERLGFVVVDEKEHSYEMEIAA